MINPYLLHILVLVAIYSIVAVSLNLALGYTGLLNLGHVAFFGIGAYTSALLTKAGVPFLVAFLAAGIIASIFGYLLYFSTKKLKGDYLALATLGFTFVLYSLLLNLTFLTRGPLGIAGIAKPSFAGIVLSSPAAYLLFTGILALVSVLLLAFIVKSPFGRVMQAIRDDEIGVRVLGKNTLAVKGKVMMISAFFAGLAGSVFAHYITFIEPGSFTLTEVVLVLTIVIVGGLASLRGSILAAFILLLIPELLRFLAWPSSILGPGRQILYALILLAILLFRPRGLLGKVDLA